jgi:tripartite ATP-independent transporter DctP family solute receptor
MRSFLSLSMAMLLLTALLVAPCGASNETVVLKFNTVGSPQQPEVKGLTVFADEAAKLSKGRIKVQIFHSGQLGNQQSQMTGVMRGTIEMTFLDPNSVSRFDKTVGVLGAAYLFRDRAHMYAVMNGPIGQGYFDRLAKNLGVRPLDVWYLGTRELNLRDRGVRTPQEMKGIKLRMPNSPLWIAMGRALGANPTPMGFGEVYMGLKTGVIDGQDNPLPTDDALKFYEVTKYIVMTNHQIGMLWPSINERTWQALPRQYRQWIIQALAKAREYQNRLVIDEEARLLRTLEQRYGMKVVYPDVEAFRRNAAAVYQEYKRDWGDGVYEKIRSGK